MLRHKEITLSSFLRAGWASLDEKFEGEPLVEASLRELLGTAYRSLGDYEAVEIHLKRAWQIHREQLGEKAPSTLSCLRNLIELYEAWDKPEEADQWRAKLPRGEQTDSESQRRTNRGSAED